ncbi:MAG: coenzyme F420-0:L-glutamate ligase, partial [Enhydrobacter sp.]
MKPDDDLAALIAPVGLKDHDVVVLAQKIVSKAEGRLFRLSDVTPSERAIEYGHKVDKDPRLVELILRESKEVIRAITGVIIVEHRLGFVMANAGIDASNVDDPDQVGDMREPLELAAERPILLTDWRQRNRSFFEALKIERTVMFLILTLIILVAALNIISGMTMLVKDKGRDIAILRTMGATRGAVLRIFLVTGATIGASGTFAGLLLGLV